MHPWNDDWLVGTQAARCSPMARSAVRPAPGPRRFMSCSSISTNEGSIARRDRWASTSMVAKCSTTGRRRAIFDYIEGWYNPHRRHSALGYHSPATYEKINNQTADAA
jgi:hypothetical protein